MLEQERKAAYEVLMNVAPSYMMELLLPHIVADKEQMNEILFPEKGNWEVEGRFNTVMFEAVKNNT